MSILHNGPFTLHPYDGISTILFDIHDRTGANVAELNFIQEADANEFLAMLNAGYEKLNLDAAPKTCYITDNAHDPASKDPQTDWSAA
jgi:hypothetical protein